jgi:hypothetical protein
MGFTGSLLASFILPHFVATDLAAEASDTGRISRINGAATASRGNASLTLAEGTAIKVGDVISTGSESRLEITFADGSKMILGANAKLTIDSYLYDQGKSTGAALFDLTKGAFRFATGKIASLIDKTSLRRTSRDYRSLRPISGGDRLINRTAWLPFMVVSRSRRRTEQCC